MNAPKARCPRPCPAAVVAMVAALGLAALPSLALQPSVEVGAPGAPPEASRPWNVEAILATCRLTPPPGYAHRSRGMVDPEPALKLTQRETHLTNDPYSTYQGALGMGWTRPDDAYFARIPAEAREIPESFDGLPIIKFNNAQIEGNRRVYLHESGPYDQWILWDRTRQVHACIAVHRETKRVYFFEYAHKDGQTVRARSDDTCYQCHSSGPRLIRTFMIEKVDRPTLDQFNQRILSYGAANFDDDIDPKRLGPALSEKRCVPCHNGVGRGRLYLLHGDMVRYYLKDLHAMPPGIGTGKAAADQLLAGMLHNWRLWDSGRTARK